MSPHPKFPYQLILCVWTLLELLAFYSMQHHPVIPMPIFSLFSCVGYVKFLFMVVGRFSLVLLKTIWSKCGHTIMLSTWKSSLPSSSIFISLKCSFFLYVFKYNRLFLKFDLFNCNLRLVLPIYQDTYSSYMPSIYLWQILSDYAFGILKSTTIEI